MSKRNYNRRTDEEIIEDLQSKISQIQARVSARERKDSPVLKQVPRLRRTLQRFAQLAVDHGREDLSNSTLMFLAGLERMAHEQASSRARGGARQNADAE